MVACLPEASREEAIENERYFHDDSLESSWVVVGVDDFEVNPEFMSTCYVTGLDRLGREGVLSVVREILAERGES